MSDQASVFAGESIAYRSPRAGRTFEDVYVLILGFCLLGYAIMGKGFAYLGVAPLYVGEIALMLGLLAMVRCGALVASLASLPSIVLIMLGLWVVARTSSDVSQYGIDALRDSVVVLYGMFSFIVASLLIANPSRIDLIIRHYRVFSTIIVPFAPIATLLSTSVRDDVPTWAAGPPLVFVRSGELAVHLCGATAFALLGFRRQSIVWSLVLMIAVAIVFAQNRGGALAFAVPTLIAAVFSSNMRRFGQLALLGLLLATGAYFADANISLGGGRNIHLDQIVANMSSIFGDSSTGNLDGTKEWRMRWWEAIIRYTLQGDYFWSGKGFGPNLAVVDGFVVGTEHAGPLLRSPHNVHLAILARSGVPGLALWGLLLTTWFGMLVRNSAVAWREGSIRWARFFIFIGCYALAALIDATFDVALEGPMIGIWFWVIIGIGLGSSMVYWSKRPQRSGFRISASPLPVVLVAVALLMPNSQASAQSPATEPATSPCLVVRDRSDFVIEGIAIGPCPNHGIEIIGSRNVVIRNVSIRNTGEFGIRILHSENVDIRRNTIVNSLSSVYAQTSRRVNVHCNSLRDVRGPRPRGQFVQLNEVHGPDNRISCNSGINEPGRQPEDAISLYRSSGVPASPIIVERNTIVGGGPSLSGGGIMLGDDGGSHLLARENILEDPGQYGIGVAAGHNIEIIGNVVIARRQPFTNVGISVWRQYPVECRDITVKSNVVRWISKTGRPNPWWSPGNCGPVQGLADNKFHASDADVEQRKSTVRCGCSDQ